MEKQDKLITPLNITIKASVGDSGNNFLPTVAITFLFAIRHPTPTAKQTDKEIMAVDCVLTTAKNGAVIEPILFAPNTYEATIPIPISPERSKIYLLKKD